MRTGRPWTGIRSSLSTARKELEHEVLVQDAELTALPAVTDLAKHRDDDLGDGVVDPRGEQRLEQDVADGASVQLTHRLHHRTPRCGVVDPVVLVHGGPFRAVNGPRERYDTRGAVGRSPTRCVSVRVGCSEP